MKESMVALIIYWLGLAVYAIPISSRSDAGLISTNITSLMLPAGYDNFTETNATTISSLNNTVLPSTDAWQWDAAMGEVVQRYQFTMHEDVRLYDDIQVAVGSLVRAELHPSIHISHLGISKAWFAASYDLASGLEPGLVRVDFFASPNGGVAISRLAADFDMPDTRPIVWADVLRQESAVAILRKYVRKWTISSVNLEMIRQASPHLPWAGRTHPGLCWTYGFHDGPMAVSTVAHVYMTGETTFETLPGLL